MDLLSRNPQTLHQRKKTFRQLSAIIHRMLLHIQTNVICHSKRTEQGRTTNLRIVLPDDGERLVSILLKKVRLLGYLNVGNIGRRVLGYLNVGNVERILCKKILRNNKRRKPSKPSKHSNLLLRNHRLLGNIPRLWNILRHNRGGVFKSGRHCFDCKLNVLLTTLIYTLLILNFNFSFLFYNALRSPFCTSSHSRLDSPHSKKNAGYVRYM